MRCSLSRLFSSLCLSFLKPDLSVSLALARASEQQAPFQLEIQLDKNSCHQQQLKLKALTPDSLVLESSVPFFLAAAKWVNKVFRFNFLARPHPSEPPQLHVFKGRITLVSKDQKTITLAIPKDILIFEQRRNVRIKPHRKDLPNLVVWGVQKDHDEEKGVSLNHRVILELNALDEETPKSVKNISAGGLRLALAPQVLTRNKEWLEPGRKLIVQLVFSGPDCSWASKHMFVAKICNARTQYTTRPELGIQFLASRVHDPKPGWKALAQSGCEALARVIQAMQVHYHTEGKPPPLARPGDHAGERPEIHLPRREA